MDDLTLSARTGGGMIHTLATALSKVASAGFTGRKAVSIAGA